MKAIVFIGSNSFGTSMEALTIAKEMGYFVVLLTDRLTHNQEDRVLDVDQVIFITNLFDRENVLNEIHFLQNTGKQICACVSFIDPYVSYAAEIAKQLGLFELSIDALSLMENKINVRKKLNELPTSPFFAVLNHDSSPADFAAEYQPFLPLIVKSPISNGSKDVMLVETVNELRKGILVLKNKVQNHPILIEEFLIGPQYLIEVLVHNGKIEIVGVIEQEISNEHVFIVVGYNFPARLNQENYASLINNVEEIIQQLHLTNGSCHLEMRLVQGAWKLIEINPRMSGGAMNRIIEEGTGINLVKEILKMNVGEHPFLLKTRNQHVYARYVTIRTNGRLLEVTGVEQAWAHKGVKYVFVKPVEGKIITVPYSMGNRYACVIAASETPEHAKTIAISAAREIKFYLEPL